MVPLSRIKNHGIKTTSKKTGAIILTVFLIIVSLSLVFLYISFAEAEMLQYEENKWRLQPCEKMIADHAKNPEIWKRDGIIDKKC